MKKKPELEADLDAPGHTRPGAKAAEAALANATRGAARKRRPASSEPTRPGATAAVRAVAATKRKRPRAK